MNVIWLPGIARHAWIFPRKSQIIKDQFYCVIWSNSKQDATNEPPHDKTNILACAPSEDSDQPGHPPSLIRVFTVQMKKAWVLSYPLSVQQRLWSDWADAQADLSLCWAHMPFCLFCHDAAQIKTVFAWDCSYSYSRNRTCNSHDQGLLFFLFGWLCWLCWGLTSQSTIFQSCRDGAIASWVINQYFRGVKCLAQGHNTAAVGLEPRTSRSGVRHSTTEPPRSPFPFWFLLTFVLYFLISPGQKHDKTNWLIRI